MKCDIFHANTSYHAMILTFDPLTLKVYGRSGVTSQSVLNLIEIEQPLAELFTIWQIFARVTSRCDLDLWPLDLELLWSFGRYAIKLCVKFEQNRTNRCRFIDDLAIYFRGGGLFQTLLLRGGWTELYQIWREESCIIGAPDAKLW